MLKICLYCDHNYDTSEAVRGGCPQCFEIEPKHIQGYRRSKHPLYNRWIQMQNFAMMDYDATFKSFYLFTKWFSERSSNFSSIVIRKEPEKGFTIQNCYVDTVGHQGSRTRLFLHLDVHQRQQLKTLVDRGYSENQIAKVFGIAHTTAKRLVEDHKRHEQMVKYA